MKNSTRWNPASWQLLCNEMTAKHLVKMRRNEREIKDRQAIDNIIRRCQVCRIALCDGDQPYIVPLSFGYDGDCLFFHAALEGRKIDLIRKNNRAAFEFDILNEIVTAGEACGWGMRYESVMGTGRMEVVDKPEDKSRALAWIMCQYGSTEHVFPEQMLKKTLVLRLTILTISGKQRP